MLMTMNLYLSIYPNLELFEHTEDDLNKLVRSSFSLIGIGSTFSWIFPLELSTSSGSMGTMCPRLTKCWRSLCRVANIRLVSALFREFYIICFLLLNKLSFLEKIFKLIKMVAEQKKRIFVSTILIKFM